MAILPVIKIGHPTLRKKSQLVSEFDDELKQLAENMIETMRLEEGIGLAAPQVNVSRRMFVIDLPILDETLEAKAYVNPEIKPLGQSGGYEEGCLSIPGIRADVVRPEVIEVSYQLLDGTPVKERMEGLLARVFQHENDHLEGILFIDHLSPLQRKLFEPQLKELQGVYTYR